MRFILLLAICLSAGLAQRTGRICGIEGDPARCRDVETSRVGGLRLSDYRITEPAATLLAVHIRRTHLNQIPLAQRNSLCVANPNRADYLQAPAIRYTSLSGAITETETLIGGQLDQEVYAQITGLNFILSDGLSLPSFSFRLSRSRGSDLVVLKLNPVYLAPGVNVPAFQQEVQFAANLRTESVSFPAGLPDNAQLLRLVWAVARALPELLEAADLRLVEPPPFGRELFSPNQFREFANRFGSILASQISPAPEPVRDASCTRRPLASCPAQAQVESFATLLARHGSEYLATGSPLAAQLVRDNLDRWASAEALAAAHPTNLMTLLRPVLLVWPVLRGETSEPQRSRINRWVDGLRQRLPALLNDPAATGTEAASLLALSAIDQRDDERFQLAVERYWLALHQMRTDGSLPMEAQRGPCALAESNRAVASLVLLAEAAAAQGYDLYSLAEEGKSLETAISFLLELDANPNLTARYFNSSAFCELGPNAAVNRRAFQYTRGEPTPAAWVEIWIARFPVSPLSTRLRSRLNLSGYQNRPLFHELAAANTSCLFLTPQEASPLVIPPLFEILDGDGQSGATRTTLGAPLRVRTRTAGGQAIANVLVQFAVHSGAATVQPAAALTNASGVAETRLTLGPRSGPIRVRATGLGTPLEFSASALGNDPKLTPGGVVGAGGSIPSIRTVTPGAILSLYGADFVPEGRGRRAMLESNRLPTVLEGVCVYFDSTPGFMLDAYPGQLNVVAPAVAGPTTTIRVHKQCGQPDEERTEPETLPVAAAAPEFFFYAATPTGENPVAAVDAINLEFLGPLTILDGLARPARPGELVTVYLSGLGATTPAVSPGTIATAVSRVNARVEVRLAGRLLADSDVLYAGFSPGSLIYQVNFRVPTGLPAANQPIEVRVGDARTPPGAYLTLSLR
jgi:uncharacterized protein (TIGR03437 family)